MIFLRRNKLAPVDFRTDSAEHGHRAIGVGVYEQAIPDNPGEILFDGEAVSFRYPETVRRALAAAREAEALKVRRTSVDCFGFVALYGAGIDVADVPSDKGDDPWLDISFADLHVDPDDIEDGATVAIGFKLGAMTEPVMTHALVAAETSEQMMFFHVLGTNGPLALSGLDEAQKIFRSHTVRQIENIRLTNN